MHYYIGVVHKDKNSAFGIHFPDVPGCFSAADDLNDLVPNAVEALSLYGEDVRLPDPRAIDAVRGDKDVRADLAAGAFLIAIPLIGNEAKTVRANITMERGMLKAVDLAAEARKLTRSAFLALAARHEIER